MKYFYNIFFTLTLLLILPTVYCQEFGKASYYHQKFNGRRTASGEIFNNSLYTGAHRSYPFQTMVKVTNLENGKSVVVKINDRGPFRRDRVIDISKAAASELDMIAKGIVDVKVELYTEEERYAKQAKECLSSSFPLSVFHNTKQDGYLILLETCFSETDINQKYQELKLKYGKKIRRNSIMDDTTLKGEVILGPFPTYEKAKKGTLMLEARYQNCPIHLPSNQ